MQSLTLQAEWGDTILVIVVAAGSVALGRLVGITSLQGLIMTVYLHMNPAGSCHGCHPPGTGLSPNLELPCSTLQDLERWCACMFIPPIEAGKGGCFCLFHDLHRL